MKNFQAATCDAPYSVKLRVVCEILFIFPRSADLSSSHSLVATTINTT
jgi:hypothetical protein